MWHFMGLWTTFVAGFSYMFLGFEIRDGGHSLASTVGITLLGYGIYVVYAMFSSYTGARTGQTFGLLTRSVFGSVGSVIVCLFVLIAPLGWVGLPGEPAGDTLGRLLQLGAHLLADADRRRAHDLQQPARLHRDQRVRALPRHAAPDPVGAVHGDQGLRRRRRVVRRDAAGQRPAAVGRRHRGDRLLDVGQRAGLLALRQAEVLVADLDVPVRRRLLHAVHDGGLDDGRSSRPPTTRRRSSTSPSTTRSSAGSGSRGSSRRSARSRSTTATTTSRSTPARTSSAAGGNGGAGTP